MNDQTDQKHFAGLDKRTFSGAIQGVSVAIFFATLMAVGLDKPDVLYPMALVEAASLVWSHIKITKGDGYRQLFASIKCQPGLWLAALTVPLVVSVLAAFLLRATL